jgi:hypothetical protein
LSAAYGLGVAGSVYREAYSQSVQGLVFADRIFQGEISSQQGSHYRFEYQWEFYPRHWFLTMRLGIEHVSATSASLLFGQTGTFEMSHTDVGSTFKLERDFGKFTLGFLPRLQYRLDSGDSTYQSRSTGAQVSKQRHDFDVTLQGNVSVPLLPSLQLFAWYEWDRIASNIGPDDYVDRNFHNQTVGLGLKTWLSTY